MDVMQAYAESLSDKALIEMSRRNLVESQARVIRAELTTRGLALGVAGGGEDAESAEG